MEEYINAYYGGTLGIAKRYGIEKGDKDFTTANNADAFNVVYGAKVWNQLNTKSEVAKLLKKEPWTQSGWRVMTTRPVNDSDAATYALGQAEGDPFGDTSTPTIDTLEATLKEIVTPYEISTKAELLSDADDGLKGLSAFMRKEMSDAHVFGMDAMLLADSDVVTTQSAKNLETIDRCTLTDAAAHATLTARGDIDMYGMNRDTASIKAWMDAAYVKHNSGTNDVAVSTAELDACIEASLENGVNYSDLIFLTGHDTYMNIQQLLTKGGDGGAATILRYDQAAGGGASINGVLGESGLNYDSRVGSYNGIPIFVSQHVAKDVTSRLHLLDLPQLALRVAAPTTYVANDNLAVTQSLTKQYALITAMELICYRFNTHASIRDMNA